MAEILPKNKLQKVRKWYYEEKAGICYDVGMKIKDLQFKKGGRISVKYDEDFKEYQKP